MNNITKDDYPVSGMTCASCALSVEKILSRIEGVKVAEVNFANSSVHLEYEDSIQKELLKEKLNAAGFDLFILDDSKTASNKFELEKENELKKLTRDTAFSCVLTAPIAVIGMFYPEIQYANWIMLVLSALVLFFFGQRFYVNAYKQLMQKTANMDSLVAVSTGVAFFFSVFNTVYPEYWTRQGLEAYVYFEAAAVIICFILLGKLLEEKAKSSTSSAIKKLIGLQAQNVTIVDQDGNETVALIESVQIGNLIRVRPGDKIPVDGKVISGSSYIDESMISGEPIPVQAEKGKSVFAGTINQKGSFILETEKVGSETVLSQIIKMVQEAQGSKAPVQKIVDKVAGIFVPTVLVISAITFISWMILGNENAFSHALLTSITVLVIACPCALGLATPTAIMVGIGKGAEHHILIKNAESLELAHKVNVVILDKTGTITEGKPVVTDLIWEKSSNHEQQTLESLLLSMESQSEHPLAVSIVEYLENKKTSKIALEHFESITGKGIFADFNNEKFVVGNEAILTEAGVDLSDTLKEVQLTKQNEGKTLVYFASNKEVLATIAITDALKSTSKAAIKHLTELGIEVYMLTGDHIDTATIIANQVGIKNVIGGVLPSEKADKVKELQKQGFVVAMVGDGINDSQALAEADVSIAMGKGSDIAMDVAQMTLMTSDLKVIPKAFALSRQTVLTIKENLFWAFIYNLIGIPLAAGVLYSYNGFLLNPMIAAGAMAFSSVSVVLNSLRLKLRKLT